MSIDVDYDDFSSDDYLDDGSVADLSDYFRSFSFWKEDVSGVSDIDRDDMYAFLSEMGLEPSKMSNNEIASEFYAIMSGNDESVDDDDMENTILVPDIDDIGEQV